MKEVITNRQGMSLIILFLSDAVVFATATEAKSDIWIAILLGLGVGLILATLYSWILSKYPSENLYDILTIIFGKWLGSLIGVIYILYCLYVGALVLVTLELFTSTVSLTQTPQVAIVSLVTILIVASLKRGIEVMGRWSEYFVKILLPMSVITVIFMLPMIKVNNLKPVLADGWQPVIEGVYGVVAFPFAEIAIFMLILSTKSVRQVKGVYHIFVGGLAVGGLFLFASHVIAFVQLQQYAYSTSYFPIYAAVSRINIMDAFQRIEIVVVVAFIMGGYIKASLYVLAGCEGIRKIMKLSDYRFMVTPISIFVLIIALTAFEGIMDLINHIRYYNILTIIMQVILPIIISIVIIIRLKFQKKTESQTKKSSRVS